MTTPNVQSEVLGKVDEAIKGIEEWLIVEDGEVEPAQYAVDSANEHLRLLRALKVAVEMHEGWIQEIPNFPNEWVCKSCWDNTEEGIFSVPFPCPELTEMAKEMGIVE